MPANELLLEEIRRNFDVFETALPALMKEHARMYALMRHGEFVEFFDTAADANRAGMTLYEDDLFSIQEITNVPIDLGYFSHAIHRQ